MAKRLYKSRKNKMIDGVCGGIAEYFNMDPTIVRIIAVIIGCIKGAGIIAYIIACFVIPYAENAEDDVENLKSANIDNEETEKSSSTSKKETNKGDIHSDEEFDKFFK